MRETLRVAVVDDHPLMRAGIIRTLESDGEIEIVGEGASADEALKIAQETLPDIILVDISMPGGGINAAKSITSACPVVKVVILTVSEDEETVSAALAAGATGYILKGVSGPELLRTLESIKDGASYVSPSLAARLLSDTKSRKSSDTASDDPDPLSLLTAREEQILAYVAKGMKNREIGDELNLSEKTVKHYMTNILQKLQVRNRVTAALLAQKRTGGDG
jgi:DNA-binding NarL/FixJ family response regulator